MFDKEDLLHYFDQLAEIERDMKETYLFLRDEVKRPEYKEIFSSLMEEESAHERLMEELKGIIRR
jgi:rubrerythrin